MAGQRGRVQEFDQERNICIISNGGRAKAIAEAKVDLEKSK